MSGEQGTRACSCGMADYGTPGHDGDPARGREAEAAAAAIAAARTGPELVEGIIERKAWKTQHEQQEAAAAEATHGARAARRLPAPWEEFDRNKARPYWYRSCDGLAAGLIEALSQLPPETAVETSTGPEMCGTPDGLWYYPHLGYVTI